MPGSQEFRATRSAAGQWRFTQVNVFLGDGADRLDASTLAIPVQADGGAGDNTIRTGRGADTVRVGDGDNVIVTGAGNDTVTAGNGVNEISTGAGNDVVTTGTGGSLIDAGAGNDQVTAAGGNNWISGGAGRDVLVAGAGNDLIDGGAGNDLIVGGLGADRLEGSGGNDLLFDGTVALTHPATDSLTAILAAYRPSNLASLSDISARLTVTFDTASADTLKGGSGTDWFWSNDALDVLDITSTEPRNGL